RASAVQRTSLIAPNNSCYVSNAALGDKQESGSWLRQQTQGRLGVIAPGARADVLFVDGDPLQEIEVLTRPETCLLMIVQGGRVVHELPSFSGWRRQGRSPSGRGRRRGRRPRGRFAAAASGRAACPGR